MAKQYIRPEEMRELFILVPLLKNIKISLDADLKRLTDYKKDSDNDYIEGLTFSNFELSDMPHSNTNAFHSVTENGALNYKQVIKNEAKEVKKALKEITKEMCHIEIVLDKIEIGLNALTQSQSDVLKLKYWQNATWNEIVDSLKKNNIFYSKSQIQRIAKKGIIKINVIALINMEMYKNVKELINRCIE